MSKATLERSDLASPGAKLSQGARSFQRWKDSQEHRDKLRGLAKATVPTKGSAMARLKVQLDRKEARLELDVLRSGEPADIFAGVYKFPRPTE